jgi:hypothetical protein
MGMVAVSAIAIVTATVTAYADDQPDGSSRGNTLITGTLWAQAPIYFACNLTNVGHKSRTVSTRIINGSNGKELLAKTMKLAPRITMNTTLKGLPEPGGPIYCEFTVEGSRKDFRGVAKLWPGPTAPNSSDITAIAAE